MTTYHEASRLLKAGEHLLYIDERGNEHDHGPDGKWPCLIPEYEKLRAEERAKDEARP